MAGSPARSQFWRAGLGFLLAPAATSLVLLLKRPATAGLQDLFGPYGDTGAFGLALELVPRDAAFVVPVAYLFTALVGLPLYVALRGRVRQGVCWPILAGCAVATLFVMFVVFVQIVFFGGLNIHNLRNSLPGAVFELPGDLVAGGAGGFVFWLVTAWRGPGRVPVVSA